MSCISCSSYLDGFIVSWDVASGICSIYLVAFLWSFSQAFYQDILSASIWCIHIVVLTQPLLGKNYVLFYRISQTYIWSIAYRKQSRLWLGVYLLSLSVDETLLPRYVNLSTNFREPPFRVSILVKTYGLFFVKIHFKANASCCLLQAWQQGFSLGRWICKKHYVSCIVCVRNSFCGDNSFCGGFCCLF